MAPLQFHYFITNCLIDYRKIIALFVINIVDLGNFNVLLRVIFP